MYYKTASNLGKLISGCFKPISKIKTLFSQLFKGFYKAFILFTNIEIMFYAGFVLVFAAGLSPAVATGFGAFMWAIILEKVNFSFIILLDK